MCTSPRSAGRTYRQAARAVPGVRKPLGPTVVAAFRRTGLRFLPGRRPRPAAAPSVPRLIATAPTFRQTRILPFTFVPTKLPAAPTSMAEPVLQRPCGPAIWLLPINRRLPTAMGRSASSIRHFIRLAWVRAMTAIFTTSPVAATVFQQQPATTWRLAGAVRTDRA